MEVEHVDGSKERAEFPSRISAYQPFFAVRALKHEFAPGAFVTARLEGDTFEMEDQRNWSDASFKTYVRPIGLPWPYELKAGQQLEQRVSLTIEGQTRAEARAKATGDTTVSIGGCDGQDAEIGIEIPAAEAAASQSICRCCRLWGRASLSAKSRGNWVTGEANRALSSRSPRRAGRS